MVASVVRVVGYGVGLEGLLFGGGFGWIRKEGSKVIARESGADMVDE